MGLTCICKKIHKGLTFATSCILLFAFSELLNSLFGFVLLCRDTLEAYSREVLKLSRTLLCLIAEILHMKTEFFNDMFGENVQAVRMNYYPPCRRPDLVLGLSGHSDGSALTVLLQDDTSMGLQILNNSRWISVEPIPNTLVINIGDTLEVSKCLFWKNKYTFVLCYFKVLLCTYYNYFK